MKPNACRAVKGNAVIRADELPPHVLHALNAGRKIEAIKLLRKTKGIGPVEAKEAVDSVSLARSRAAPPHRAAAKNDTGVARLILVFVVLGACLAAYFYVSGSY